MRILILLTLIFLMNGCVNNLDYLISRVNVPEPKRVEYKKYTFNIEKYFTNPEFFVQEALNKIEIVPERPEYRKKLYIAVNFLISTFGPPFNLSRVIIKVNDEEFLNHGTTIVGNRTERIIKLQSINFGKYSDGVLIHELFHALYQTENFIYSFPDFIVEGMATFAEYLYSYGYKKGYTVKQIIEVIEQNIKNLNWEKNWIDCDKNFNLLLPMELRNFYYLKACEFIARINFPKMNIDIIRLMLSYPMKKKITFQKVVEIYNLKY